MNGEKRKTNNNKNKNNTDIYGLTNIYLDSIHQILVIFQSK